MRLMGSDAELVSILPGLRSGKERGNRLCGDNTLINTLHRMSSRIPSTTVCARLSNGLLRPGGSVEVAFRHI